MKMEKLERCKLIFNKTIIICWGNFEEKDNESAS